MRSCCAVADFFLEFVICGPTNKPDLIRTLVFGIEDFTLVDDIAGSKFLEVSSTSATVPVHTPRHPFGLSFGEEGGQDVKDQQGYYDRRLGRRECLRLHLSRNKHDFQS